MKKINATDQQKDPNSIREDSKVQIWSNGSMSGLTDAHTARNMVSMGLMWVINDQAVCGYEMNFDHCR